MTTVFWMPLGSPGQAGSAQPTADTTAIAVTSMGGHLYLRRRTDSGWAWEHGGRPPDAEVVNDAAPLATPEGAPLTLAVAASNGAWLYQSKPSEKPWVSLGGPPGNGGIVAIDVGTPGAPQPTLIMNRDNQLFIHAGLDPATTWFAIGPDYGTSNVRQIQQFAPALATVPPATTPQLHVFVLILIDSGPALRVGLLENSVWRWSEPTGAGAMPPSSGGNGGVSATTIRDAAGSLQACAVLGTGADEDHLSIVIGGGHSWTWSDLGQPSAQQSVGSAVVADKGRDPFAGEPPTVVARTGHHHWTRPLTGAWTDHGTTPGDVAVVVPGSALDRTGAAQQDIWISGTSWGFDLWTAELGGAATWENHGTPGTIESVVGAYTDAPMQDVFDTPLMVFASDEQGELWACQLFVSAADSQFFMVSSESWTYHGAPAPGVTVSAGIGAMCQPGSNPVPIDGPPPPSWAFVVGSDARLYARTTNQSGWFWKNLGSPTGTLIVSGVGPIVGPAAGPTVHVLGQDGNVYMGSFSGNTWTWTNREMPRGNPIFSLVGAVARGADSQVVVITADGQLWVNVVENNAFVWHQLGAPPAPQESVVAGIGVEALDSGPSALAIAVLGRPSNQIWTLQWSPGAQPTWTAKGTPNNATIKNRLSTFKGRPSPGTPTPIFIGVVGNDNQVWVSRATEAGPTWARWDPNNNRPAANARGGAVYMFLSALDQRPCAVVLDRTGRVHMMTP